MPRLVNGRIRTLKRRLAEEEKLRESIGRRVVRPAENASGSGVVVNVGVEGLIEPESAEEAAYYQRLSDMTRPPSKRQLARTEAKHKERPA